MMELCLLVTEPKEWNICARNIRKNLKKLLKKLELLELEVTDAGVHALGQSTFSHK